VDFSKQRSALRLLWSVIVRPRAALAYISEHGGHTWWLPALVIVLLVTTPVLVSAPTRTQQIREEMRTVQEEMAQQLGQEMSEEQLERAISLTASPLLTVIFPAVGAGVGRAVGWLVWAGSLYLAAMVFGGRGTFGQMFRIVVWAWLPYALRGLLQTVYVLASGQLIAHHGLSGLVQNERAIAEALSAAPGPGQTLLVAFLSRIDLFLIWSLVLLVIGVRVSTRLSRRKSVLLTLGVWILLTALSLLPTLIGGLFAAQMAV
jgi:hypothetical protein